MEDAFFVTWSKVCETSLAYRVGGFLVTLHRENIF